MSQWSEIFREIAYTRKMKTGDTIKKMSKEMQISNIAFANLMNGIVKKPHRHVAREIVKFTQGALTMKDLGYDDYI